VDAPIISIVSAISGTLLVSLVIDAGFPTATTTFWVIDPLTGQPAFTFAGEVPPTASLAGLSEDAEYELVAQSVDGATLSPPSSPIRISPVMWSGKLKNVITGCILFGAREYKLYNADTDALLDTAPYPCFVDAQVFGSELLAQQFNYRIKGFGPSDSDEGVTVEIDALFRTTKALCLVTGEMASPRGDGHYDWPMIFQYREEQRWPQDPAAIQRAYQVSYDVQAYPNYLGQWGVYLMQGAIVEMWNGKAQGPRNRLEIVVPATSTVAFVDLPQVARAWTPKRT